MEKALSVILHKSLPLNFSYFRLTYIVTKLITNSKIAESNIVFPCI